MADEEGTLGPIFEGVYFAVIKAGGIDQSKEEAVGATEFMMLVCSS